MPSVGFEPTIPTSERPQTYALDGAATGTGKKTLKTIKSRVYKFLILKTILYNLRTTV
jgi:hypothetical protein